MPTMRVLTLLLVTSALALAGCTDDGGSADDDGTGTSTGTGTGTGSGAGTGTGGGGGGTPTENVTVEITWSGAYMVNGEYSTDTITVPANATVTLTFTNEDPVAGHDFVVEGIEGASTPVLDSCPTGSGCESETITFNAGPAQDTQFFCSVSGHRANGMEGDFIVE